MVLEKLQFLWILNMTKVNHLPGGIQSNCRVVVVDDSDDDNNNNNINNLFSLFCNR